MQDYKKNSLLNKMVEQRLRGGWLPWKKIFWRCWGVKFEELQLSIGEPIWEFIKRYPRLKRLCIWLFEYKISRESKTQMNIKKDYAIEPKCKICHTSLENETELGLGICLNCFRREVIDKEEMNLTSPPLSQEMNKMECALCKINGENNKLYYEDDKIIIVECATCKVPMGVLKRHTMQPSTEEEEDLTQALYSVAKRILGNFRIDTKQRAIKDHLHYHARR